MSDEKSKPGEGLAYSDNISVAWKYVDHEPDQNHLSLVNASNEDFLRAVAVIGENTTQKEPTEASGSVAQELVRLDLKLNILLDLVSTLIYHELDLPETRPVSVSAAGVAWRGQAPEPGRRVFLQLYIQRGLPKPLCCYGDVVSTAEDCATDTAKVRFVGLSGSALSWLEKLIFRHHRRDVAFRRSRK
ncbi:MAG: hypothetical protein ACI87W_001272 [Halieaceae bacterium]|jgi:hypothetical protein